MAERRAWPKHHLGHNHPIGSYGHRSRRATTGPGSEDGTFGVYLKPMARRGLTVREGLHGLLVTALRSAVPGGSVIGPDAPGFDEARRVWNGDDRAAPAAVVRAAGGATSRRRSARASLGLPLAVRGGGHNVAGNGTVDGGIVLDLGGLKPSRRPSDPRGPRRAGRDARPSRPGDEPPASPSRSASCRAPASPV